MKKRILALLLAFSMMLSLLPVSAFADTGGGIDSAVYASNGSLPDLVMGNNGMPDVSQIEPDSRGVYQGNGWMYSQNSDALMLRSGTYDFNYTSPGYRTGDHLNCVNVTHIVVQLDATIVGGMFNGQSLSNHGTVENSLLSTNDIESGGTMTNWTNCLFKRLTPPVGVANCHKLTEVNNSEFEATLLNAPSGFMGWETYYFTGTPTLKVKLPSNKKLHHINGEEHYNDLTGPDEDGYYTFTPKAGDDIVLNREPYATDLVMTTGGIPETTGREPIYDTDGKTIIGYKGDGWTYKLNDGANGKGVLTLMQRSNSTANYIFSDSSWNYSTAIECDVIVEGPAQIHNGVFHGAVTLNASAVASESIFTGTVTLEGISNQISWSYFSKNAHLVGFENGTIWHCVFAGDTSGYPFSTYTEYCLFASKPAGLTTYELRTEDDKEFSATLYSNFLQGKCPEKLTGQMMYVQKDANLIVRRTDDLEITDGTACTETDWSGWYYKRPYSSDTILKRNYHLTVENGTLKGTTDAQGDFGSGTHITVQANAPTDTDTFFTGWTVTPADTKLMNGTADVDLTQSTITFDMPIAPDDLTLTATYAPYVTDLEMTPSGFPVTTGREPIYDSTNNVIGYKGEDWKYENGTLTLESGSYDFSTTKPTTQNGDVLKLVDCKVVVENGATITGGHFRAMSNYGTVENSLLSNNDIINCGGTMTNCLFCRTKLPEGVTGYHKLTEVNNNVFDVTLPNAPYIFSGYETYYFTGTPTLVVCLAVYGGFNELHHINGRVDYGGLSDPDAYGYYTFTPEKEEDIVLNDSIIHEPFTMTNGYPTASNGGKTACKGEGWEYILGDPEHGDFLFLSNAQIDFSKISDGSPVECKLFIGHGVAVQGGTFNGDVINYGGILGGTFNGAVENHGTIENGVFNGAVTNIAPGTVSNSITGTGTLNGKPITPNAYTLTVTGGGLVNGKTSAVVEAGKEVRLTVGEMQEGMSFNYWDLPTALTKALMAEDSTFSNKVENLTFTMPDLSKYTEDTRFTIRLDIRPAELPDDDDGPSVLGTMATVAVGGAAAGILVWQGVSLGVDSYLQLSLPGGVPVPANRRELVKLLWETAGKPDVVLPALYGDVSTEDAELQKATRWAIDNGLVKPADESDASRFDPDRSVSKYEVARAWFKVKKLMK